MSYLRTCIWRLAGLFGKERKDRELAEELESHLQMHIADNIRSGMDPAEARRQALIQLGGLEQTKERCRERRGWLWLESLLQDVRFGARMLRKSPGFTGVAVLTLALGIGANTAIFSVINSLMLRTLPVRDPGQLVELLHQFPGEPAFNGFSWDAYQLMRDNRVLSALIVASQGSFALRMQKLDRQTVFGGYVNETFFETLGVRAAIGRLIGPEDERMESPSAVAVASWSFWKTRFNLAPSILGSQIIVNDVSVTIVGVTEQRFTGLSPEMRQDVWLPISMNPVIGRSALGWGSIGLVGRLKQGVSIEQARAELAVLFQSAIQLPDAGPFVKQMKFVMQPAGSGLSTPLRRILAKPLLVLMPTVGLVLLIACTNVATLLLARGAARQHEISVRICLGAGRFRLVRQALTESLLLSVAGTLGGVFFAIFAARGLLRMLTSGREIVGLPVSVDALARPDLHVLLFTGAIALLTALLFGVAPAMHALSTTPAPALQQSVRASESKLRRLFGRTLVISQVALSVALLSSAALFASHLLHLQNLDLGFRRDHLLLVTLDTAHSGYEAAQLSRLSQGLLGELETVPGVGSATLSGMTPIQGPGASSIAVVEGQPDNRSDISVNYVAPNYFKTYGTPLLAGRDFSVHDRDGAPVALINQTMARHFFDMANPVGSHVTLNHTTARRDDKSYEIVGVVGDAKYNDIQQAAPRTIYLNAFQENRRVSQLTLRTNIDPEAVVNVARQRLISTLKTVPIVRVRTMTDQINASIVPERLIALLSGTFGILGALLAAIGLYGLLAYAVSRRTSEIGVRMALGATRGRVIRMVLQDAFGMVCIGLLIGAPLIFWCQRISVSLLPGLPVNNMTAIVCGAMGMMILVALFAAYIPARRAAHVDPMVALRYE